MGLLFVYLGALFALSQRRSVDLPARLSAVSDTVIHAAVYAPLGFLLTVASGPAHAAGALTGWAAATFFGAADELHQTLIPGRKGSVADVLRDSLGAGFGALHAWLWRALRRWRAHRGAAATKG